MKCKNLLISAVLALGSFALSAGLVQADVSAWVDSSKAIYKPDEQVAINIALTSDQAYEDVTIQATLARGLASPVVVYEEVQAVPEGKSTVSFTWNPPQGHRNIHGHLVVATLTDSEGVLLETDEIIFDMVDDWTKVMRLHAMGAFNLTNKPGGTTAIEGERGPTYKTDSGIRWNTKFWKKQGYNTFEMFHYADPYNMNQNGEDVWVEIDRKKYWVSRDRLKFWGTALHEKGMKYLAYNEMLSITGPDEWKLTGIYNNVPWCSYYCDDEREGVEYFLPNANYISDIWKENIMSAIENFDFDGVFMDGGTGLGRVAIEQSRHYVTRERIPGTVGGFQTDFQQPVTEAIQKIRPEFGWVQSNLWHVVSKTMAKLRSNEITLDSVYDDVASYVESREMLKLTPYINLYSIEWDSSNSPRDRYPQTYEEMTIFMAALGDLMEQTVLQWAFLSGQNSTVAYVRPKMATYLAAGMTINDHHNAYHGPLRGVKWRTYPANIQIMQYRRFWARYSYYTTNAARKLVRDPQFTLESTQPLFWKEGVREMLVDGKKEITINVLNLPSSGLIQGQKEIPPVADNAMFGIPKELGFFVVTVLNADNPDLTPVILEPVEIDNAYFYELPPVVAWQVLVLSEAPMPVKPPPCPVCKARFKLEETQFKLEEISADIDQWLKDN